VKVKTLGIDLAKETFGLHGVDPLGRVVVHRRITRKQLLGFLVKLEPCLVGMEASYPTAKATRMIRTTPRLFVRR
jgi:transposase